MKKRTTCKWDQLKSNPLHILKVPKPTLVRLASSNLFILLGIPTWGVGSSPKNVMAKMKKDEDIVRLIQGSRVAYAKAFKGAWDNQIWKNTPNKMVW